MHRNLLETIIGGLVLLVAALFLYFAYTHSTFKTQNNGYHLQAKFDRIDGLLVGSEVRMSGVKIGNIVSLELDPNEYLAIARFSIRKDLKLPTDSSAEVQTDGLLGDKYLSLVPGGDETFLKENEEIINTQSSINLTDLIGQAIFSSKKDKDSDAEDKAPEEALKENSNGAEDAKKDKKKENPT